MARPLPKPHGRPQGAGGGERSKPARLAVRDHHRRSLCGKSPAQSEQWYCWIDRRRIISASAENRGNSCQRKHKEEERRERYDRGRDIAPVAMTATLEPGTRAKNTSDLADSLLGGAAAAWPLAARPLLFICFGENRREEPPARGIAV